MATGYRWSSASVADCRGSAFGGRVVVKTFALQSSRLPARRVTPFPAEMRVWGMKDRTGLPSAFLPRGFGAGSGCG
jgi:hypothetical protein